MRRVGAGTVLAWTLALILGFGLAKERRSSRALAIRAGEQTTELEGLRAEAAHLRHFHRAVVPTLDPFLSGWDVTRDSVLTLQGAHDGLFYVIETSCPVCAANLPALAEVQAAASDGFVVVALSLVDSLGALSDYAGRHSVAFPVLHGATGGLLELVPRLGTPFAIVVSDGCVVDIGVGEFSRLEIEQFKFFGSRASARGGMMPRLWTGC